MFDATAVHSSLPLRRSTTPNPSLIHAVSCDATIASCSEGSARRHASLFQKDSWPVRFTAEALPSASLTRQRVICPFWLDPVEVTSVRPSCENAKPSHQPSNGNSAINSHSRRVPQTQAGLASCRVILCGESKQRPSGRKNGPDFNPAFRKVSHLLSGLQVPHEKPVPMHDSDRQPPAVGGNGHRVDFGFLAQDRRRIATRLPPEVTPLPPPEINLAGLGTLPVEQILCSPQIVAAQRFLATFMSDA